MISFPPEDMFFDSLVGLKEKTMDARTQVESFVRNVRVRNRRETIACLIA